MPGAAKVLFVCGGNTCRSPMAVGIFRRLIEEQWKDELGRVEVNSAGLAAVDGCPASYHASSVLASMGIDIRDHRSRSLNADMVREADFVLTMTTDQRRQVVQLVPEAEGKVFVLKNFPPGPEESGRDLHDPFGQGREAYEELARELDRVLRRVAGYLAEQDP